MGWNYTYKINNYKIYIKYKSYVLSTRITATL